jgi:hypothetical protein
MGLASGKTKLRLIDIESNAEPDSARSGGGLSRGGPRPARKVFTRIDGSNAEDGATEIGNSLRAARERSGQASRTRLVSYVFAGNTCARSRMAIFAPCPA